MFTIDPLMLRLDVLPSRKAIGAKLKLLMLIVLPDAPLMFNSELPEDSNRMASLFSEITSNLLKLLIVIVELFAEWKWRALPSVA